MENDERQDTVKDIVAEMRRFGDRHWMHDEGQAVREFANRIEAAAKRDEERAVEHATRHAEAVARDNCRDCIHNPNGKNFEGGNAAAMREALKTIHDKVNCLDEECGVDPVEIRDIARAALAEPARRCDVGTAEERAVRFRDMCNKYYDDENPCNKKCPLASLPIIHWFPRCQAYWAQTPYAAEEGGSS